MSMSFKTAIESVCMRDRDQQLSASAQRVEREANCREFCNTELQVVIGDGVSWIWRLVDVIFAKAFIDES